MKSIHLRMLGLACFLTGLILVGLGMRKQVTSPTGSKTLRSDRDVQMTILADRRTLHISSTERLPANVLAQAGVRLFPGDQVRYNGVPVDVGQPIVPVASNTLQVRRAIAIHLIEGSSTQVILSSTATLGQALAAAGISLTTADRLDPAPETPLPDQVQTVFTATLRQAQAVTINFKGGQLRLDSAAETVGEALAQAGLALQGLDYSQPSAEQPLPPDGQIRLVRVRETVQLEQAPLAFETETQPAPDIELDSRKVLQNGQFGLTARRIRLRYEDGQQVARTVEDEWVAVQPQKRIIGYGTKVVVRSMSTPDGPIEYWRAVQMYATSYSPCRIYKDHCDAYTASGATLKKGVVAMTNAWYRYNGGDKVYVPGYGLGVVADTGGGIPGQNWIDLGYSEEDFVNWHQTVTVYFLTPVPANIQWVLP